MIKLGIGILTHPQRLDMANKLADRLELEKQHAVIAVSIDMDGIGPGFNYSQLCRCFDGYDVDAVLMLQDDVETCRDFVQTVQKSLPYLWAKHGLCVASYYHNSAKAKDALANNHMWFRYSLTAWKNWYPTYAFVWPMPVVTDFPTWYDYQRRVNWGDRNVYTGRKRKVVSDFVLSVYVAEYVQIPVYCTTLGFAQHMGGMESLIDHKFDPKTGRNTCPNFIGVHSSGLTYDWSVV